MRRILLLLVSFALTQTLVAQDWAKEKVEKSPRHREWVTVKHDGRSVETFVVYPESSGKRPVVLVIHEIFGMSDWVQDLADQLAAAGYIAVAPDLLSGMGPNGGRTSSFADQNGVMEAIRDLKPEQMTADLNAVADYGLKLPASNGKLFVTGYCWGGGQSFRFATNRKDLKAAFVFYGPPPDKDAMTRITAPVYGFYAGNDSRSKTWPLPARRTIPWSTTVPVTDSCAPVKLPTPAKPTRKPTTKPGQDGRNYWASTNNTPSDCFLERA
jgi:carboxymethylenebutenolidase